MTGNSLSLSFTFASCEVWSIIPHSYPLPSSSSYEVSSCIDSEEDKEKDGKAPERRASITEERKRDADNRSKPQYHTDINKHVKEEDTEYTITIYSPKLEGLSLGKNNQPDDQSQEQQQHSCRS